MTSTEEALSLLANAREALMQAEGTLRIGFYRPAVSLAYYAAFYAAQALVAYHRDSPKTHKGTRDRFWYRAVAHSDFPPQVASIVGTLSTGRLKADYDHATMQDWSENDAAKAIRLARRFVTEVDEWFNRHYPKLEENP